MGNIFSRTPDITLETFPTPVFGISIEDLFSRDGESIPRVLIQLCVCLVFAHDKKQHLFLRPGNPLAVEKTKKDIEKNGKFNMYKMDPYVCASLIKELFIDMPTGVIPLTQQRMMLAAYDRLSNNQGKMISSLMEIVEEMPNTHKSLLKFICDFCWVVTKEPSKGVDMADLAMCIGPNLFKVELHEVEEGVDELTTLMKFSEIINMIFTKREEIFKGYPYENDLLKNCKTTRDLQRKKGIMDWMMTDLTLTPQERAGQRAHRDHLRMPSRIFGVWCPSSQFG